MWIRALRIYLVCVAVANVVWETLQLPLYTIWQSGTLSTLTFAVAHCTAGDVIIAVCALALALLVVGDASWPRRRFSSVAIATIVFGVAYTIFSEWLNVVVRASWAYSNLMPAVSAFGLRIGLSPLLQWFVIPAVAFAIVKRLSRPVPT